MAYRAPNPKSDRVFWDRILAAADLRLCSWGARGFWLGAMLPLCGTSPVHGFLMLNGRALTAADLAQLTATPVAEVEGYIAELEAHGVFSRNKAGCIYNRAMVRAEKMRANGASGWDKARKERNYHNLHRANPASPAKSNGSEDSEPTDPRAAKKIRRNLGGISPDRPHAKPLVHNADPDLLGAYPILKTLTESCTETESKFQTKSHDTHPPLPPSRGGECVSAAVNHIKALVDKELEELTSRILAAWAEAPYARRPPKATRAKVEALLKRGADPAGLSRAAEHYRIAQPNPQFMMATERFFRAEGPWRDFVNPIPTGEINGQRTRHDRPAHTGNRDGWIAVLRERKVGAL